MMSQDSHSTAEGARWQYSVVWRYGPLALVLLGTAMVVYAMAGTRSDAVDIALLTLGLVAFVAGVVLPRIEGDFGATCQGAMPRSLS